MDLSSDTPASINHNASENTSPEPLGRRIHILVKGACKTTLSHARSHVGVGLICSVAYFDP